MIGEVFAFSLSESATRKLPASWDCPLFARIRVRDHRRSFHQFDGRIHEVAGELERPSSAGTRLAQCVILERVLLCALSSAAHQRAQERSLAMNRATASTAARPYHLPVSVGAPRTPTRAPKITVGAWGWCPKDPEQFGSWTRNATCSQIQRPRQLEERGAGRATRGTPCVAARPGNR